MLPSMTQSFLSVNRHSNTGSKLSSALLPGNHSSLETIIANKPHLQAKMAKKQELFVTILTIVGYKP